MQYWSEFDVVAKEKAWLESLKTTFKWNGSVLIAQLLCLICSFYYLKSKSRLPIPELSGYHCMNRLSSTIFTLQICTSQVRIFVNMYIHVHWIMYMTHVLCTVMQYNIQFEYFVNEFQMNWYFYLLWFLWSVVCDTWKGGGWGGFVSLQMGPQTSCKENMGVSIKLVILIFMNSF